MAETFLLFSAEKTSFDPQAQGCLIIGQPRHLQAVTFDHFAEKLSPRVDSAVRKYQKFDWFYCFLFYLHFVSAEIRAYRSQKPSGRRAVYFIKRRSYVLDDIVKIIII